MTTVPRIVWHGLVKRGRITWKTPLPWFPPGGLIYASLLRCPRVFLRLSASTRDGGPVVVIAVSRRSSRNPDGNNSKLNAKCSSTSSHQRARFAGRASGHSPDVSSNCTRWDSVTVRGSDAVVQRRVGECRRCPCHPTGPGRYQRQRLRPARIHPEIRAHRY